MRRVLLHRPLVDRSARRGERVITHSDRRQKGHRALYPGWIRRVHVGPTGRVPGSSRAHRARPCSDARPAALRTDDRFVPQSSGGSSRAGPAAAERRLRRRQSAPAISAHHLVCVGPYGWRARDVARRVAAAVEPRPAHPLDFLGYVDVRRPAGALQPRRSVRVSVALRGFRAARRRGHGLRRARAHRPQSALAKSPGGRSRPSTRSTPRPLATRSWPSPGWRPRANSRRRAWCARTFSGSGPQASESERNA